MVNFFKSVIAKISAFFQWVYEAGEDQRTRLMTRGMQKREENDGDRD
jgi:hypothetical protein